MKKTTLKSIKKYDCIDITYFNTDEINKILEKESKLEKIYWSLRGLWN